jgi:hypothetical protein
MGRAAGSCWRRALKSQRSQVELVGECVDYAHRVIVGVEVIQAFRDQRYLLPVLTFDESGYINSRDRDTKLYLHPHSGVKEFSHSLDPKSTVNNATQSCHWFTTRFPAVRGIPLESPAPAC